jgi:hypothetical protein
MPDDLQAQLGEIVKRGRAEHPDFDNHSAYVVGISRSPNDVRQALVEFGDDAHRVVSHLADDPDAAAEILNHTGQRLGAALGKFAAKLPVKAAPEVKPELTPASAPKAAAAPDLYDSKLSTKEWAREYDRLQAEKRQKRIDDAKADHEQFLKRRQR